LKSKGLGKLLNAWKTFQDQLPSGAAPSHRSTETQKGGSTDAPKYRLPSLVLVGSGPDEAALRQQAAELNLRSVHFVGSVEYDQLPAYYCAADVFIIPTLEDNWSLVVPEAMACGLPILCSKYNGCWPELIHEGRNGWVFDPLDPAEIVRCLEACISAAGKDSSSGSSLQKMGAESRRTLSNHSPQSAATAVWQACRLAVARFE
jgi:glycosyltransferase involved in cell wall biosynthesis